MSLVAANLSGAGPFVPQGELKSGTYTSAGRKLWPCGSGAAEKLSATVWPRSARVSRVPRFMLRAEFGGAEFGRAELGRAELGGAELGGAELGACGLVAWGFAAWAS